MSKDPRIHIDQICECIEMIEHHTSSMTAEQFLEDVKTQDAVIRRLQVIGESVKALPAPFIGAHPEIPWSDMARMRDKVVHHYLELKLDRIWDAVQQDIPSIKKPFLALQAKLSGKP